MEEIYKDKSIAIFKMLGSQFLLLGVAISSIMSGKIGFVIFGLFLLAPVIYLAYTWIKKPTLVINGKKIIVRNLFGKVNEVSDTSEYKLVLSNDFFAFRMDGKNDIMVDKGWFKKETLERLIQTLRSLGFKEVIE
jgi:hypothetical protein